MKKLEVKKLELELKRVEAARMDLEIRIEEAKLEIERLSGHVEIQVLKENEIKAKIASKGE